MSLTGQTIGNSLSGVLDAITSTGTNTWTIQSYDSLQPTTIYIPPYTGGTTAPYTTPFTPASPSPTYPTYTYTYPTTDEFVGSVRYSLEYLEVYDGEKWVKIYKPGFSDPVSELERTLGEIEKEIFG